MNSPSRRKNVHLEIEREAYCKHIHKLEKLQGCSSAQKIKKADEQRRLIEMMVKVRKMHAFGRQIRQQEMKQIEQLTKETDFSKIKSVVVKDFYWPIPTMPPKHKRNQKPILHENFKIFDRIINTKSNMSLRCDLLSDRKVKVLSTSPSSDFYKVYEKSRLNASLFKIIKIKVGKSKHNIKSELLINYQQVFQTIKDPKSTYQIQVKIGELKGRSEVFILQELEISRLFLKIPDKVDQLLNLTVKLIKVLDGYETKQITKLILIPSQIIPQKNLTSLKQTKSKTKISQTKYSTSTSNFYNPLMSAKRTMRSTFRDQKQNQDKLALTYEQCLIQLEIQKQNKNMSTIGKNIGKTP